jgi:beta-lactamase regulating signal transducer with metallopeptidase domain
MIIPELHVVAQVFAERILNSAVEGVVLVGMVWLLLRVIGRQNSGTRFAIWIAALVALVALPFLSGSEIGGIGSEAFPGANPAWKLNLSSACAYYLFGAWGVGAGVSLVGLIAGLWRLHQIRRGCVEVDLAAINSEISDLLREFNSRRPVKLCASSDVSAPAAIGFFRPAIIFPAGLLSQLSLEEIRLILLHELAHLRRWDDWTNLGQKIVKAVLFFHPAVWWIESRLTLEREMACDDIVLAATSSPRAYASSLISFAEKLRNARSVALAQSLLSRVCQMSLRVAHILDTKRTSRNGPWKPVLGASAALLALLFGAAPYAPRVVAFQPQSSWHQMADVQPPQQAAKNEAVARVTDSARNRTKATSVAAPLRVAPQPRAIQAAYHPRNLVVPVRLRKLPLPAPMIMRTQAVQQDFGMPATFVILQTTRFDASGSGVWTFCVWKVGGANQTERQWESTIVVSVI